MNSYVANASVCDFISHYKAGKKQCFQCDLGIKRPSGNISILPSMWKFRMFSEQADNCMGVNA